MNKLEVLKAAKKILWTGEHPWVGNKERFICVAIDYVTKAKDKESIENGVELKKHISKLLGVDINEMAIFTLESWLKINHGIYYQDYPQKVMQEYRHRFIDHLIEQYSEEAHA